MPGNRRGLGLSIPRAGRTGSQIEHQDPLFKPVRGWSLETKTRPRVHPLGGLVLNRTALAAVTNIHRDRPDLYEGCGPLLSQRANRRDPRPVQAKQQLLIRAGRRMAGTDERLDIMLPFLRLPSLLPDQKAAGQEQYT